MLGVRVMSTGNGGGLSGVIDSKRDWTTTRPACGIQEETKKTNTRRKGKKRVTSPHAIKRNQNAGPKGGKKGNSGRRTKT